MYPNSAWWGQCTEMYGTYFRETLPSTNTTSWKILPVGPNVHLPQAGSPPAQGSTGQRSGWNSSQRCKIPSVLSSFKLRHTSMCVNSPCSQCCGVLPIYPPCTPHGIPIPGPSVCRMAVRELSGSSMWEWRTNALLPCLQWWGGFYFQCPRHPHNLPPPPTPPCSPLPILHLAYNSCLRVGVWRQQALPVSSWINLLLGQYI